MRYTTIIDLSEYPLLYRSEAVRLVYLHLVLRSGYHDHDRDLCQISLRRLEIETGLTLSAVRCAISRLINAQLIERQGQLWKVKKFVVEQPITPRAKTEKKLKQQQVDAETERIQAEHRRELDLMAERRKRERQQGKTSYMIYYEQMQEKAKQGDPQAIDFVKANAETYKMHQASIIEEQQQKKKP